MNSFRNQICRSGFSLLLLVGFVGWTGLAAQTERPEPAGWYAGDMHVHRSCGGAPVPISTIYDAMVAADLAVVSLLADMGNGEVLDPVLDLPKVNGLDDPISTPGRIVHWDAEWHWDATYSQFEYQALGGHINALGLTEAYQIWEEYTYPILDWAHQQNGIAGFVHMQYLGDGFPQSLNCCLPIEYPVEVALGTADFIAEDVAGSDTAMRAYYRLLNTGFRPGFAAGSDYPCAAQIGDLVTYVQIPDEQLTYQKWIEGIADGRTVVSRNSTNEFLELKVDGTLTPGGELQLVGGGSVSADIQWTALENLSGTIELVHNGVVVASRQASVTPGTAETLSATVDFTESGWLAARRMSGRGHEVHTGAVFVTVDDAPVRASVEDAEFYVQWMESLLQNTAPGGVWGSYFVESRDEAHARYQAAKSIYEQIALEAGSTPGLLSITTTVLPDGRVGDAYSATLAASGGEQPYEWSVTNGQLPAGLTLDSASGTISGTPIAAGFSTFTVQVSDSSTPAQTANKLLSVRINASGTVNIWDETTTPGLLADPDTSPVELGVKFRTDVDGFISGIRFYKSDTNTGTHVGNLWSADGQLLATATFTNETASGWQQVDFASPVAITANTVYVASYHTDVGQYSVDENYFAASGVDNAPLHALQDGQNGGNGVYRYGPGGFPDNTYRASNYWVDVVFATDSTAGGDTIPPAVSLTAPAEGATVGGAAVGVSADASDNVGVMSVQFLLDGAALGPPDTTAPYNTSWDSTVTTNGTHTLSAQASDAAGNTTTATAVNVVVSNGGTADTMPPGVSMTAPNDGETVSGAAVPVSADASDNVGVTSVQFLLDGAELGPPDTTAPYSISWDSTTTTNGTHTLSAQASDAAGNTATATAVDVIVSNGDGGVCETPCSLWDAATTPSLLTDPDTSAVELGVKFQSDADGYVTGVRFYKGPQNTGTHVGSLWSGSGQLLGQVTFSNETASGWQQVDFPTPVAIQANTLYVVSYHTEVGGYSVDEGYFASAYSNGPLSAPADGANGGNGVYLYGSGGFPTNSYASSNYWVDLVFETTSPVNGN